MSAANELNINVAHVERVAKELGLRAIQVGATAKLFADGATVPFIARYRKEATGGNSSEKTTLSSQKDDRVSKPLIAIASGSVAMIDYRLYSSGVIVQEKL